MVLFGTALEPIHLPLGGNSLAVGLFSLLHIVLAALSVGFMLLAPFFELRGRSNDFDRDLAFGLTRFTVIVFSVSSVLAVIMVELMIGLFPATTMWMWNHFRGPILFGMLAFIVMLLALYPYYHFWEPLQKYSLSFHTTLGILAALFMLVWVMMLDGMGSFMLTPVERGGTWQRLWNPTWLPLALHRMGGNVMIAGYCLAAYGAWRAWRPSDRPSQPYYRHLLKTGLAIGLTGLLFQPFTGLLYMTFIHRAAPATHEKLINGYQPLLYMEFTLIGLLFLGNYLLLKSTQASRVTSRWFDIGFPIGATLLALSVGHVAIRRLWLYSLVGLTAWYLFLFWRTSFTRINLSGTYARGLTVSMGILSIVLYLTMGTIREISRHPDTIAGILSLEEEARPPARTAGAGP